MDKDAFGSEWSSRGGTSTLPPLATRSTQFVWVSMLVAVLAVLVIWHRGVDVATTSAPTSPRSMGVRIDVNRATVRELSLLPGIGPKLAERIRSDRQQRGDFRGVTDLSRVPGIGPRTIERIGSMVAANRPPVDTLSHVGR